MVDWAKAQMCGVLPGLRTETLPRKDRSDAQVGFLFFVSRCVLNPRIMSSFTRLPGIRIRPDNPNHHLWNNHGTWFLHYTVHPTPLTKERVRRSLGTKDIAVARRRRDAFFDSLASKAAVAA